MSIQFYTQYESADPRPEYNMHKSMTSEVPVETNAQRVKSLQLTGALVDAWRVGYDWQHDEELPEDFRAVGARGMDITEMAEIARHVRSKAEEIIQERVVAYRDQEIKEQKNEEILAKLRDVPVDNSDDNKSE